MMVERSPRVLIVDDAPPVRALVRGFLMKLGYREADIRVACDGEEGLVVFRTHAPDIAFVDIEMPKMGGEDTAIRMLTERPDLKVVVMSAMDATDDRVKALRSFGACAVLAKPVRMDKLKEILDLLREEDNAFTRIR